MVRWCETCMRDRAQPEHDQFEIGLEIRIVEQAECGCAGCCECDEGRHRGS